MFNICTRCKGIITTRFITLTSERVIRVKVYEMECPSCGSKYEVTIKELSGPTVDSEKLTEITNRPLA